MLTLVNGVLDHPCQCALGELGIAVVHGARQISLREVLDEGRKRGGVGRDIVCNVGRRLLVVSHLAHPLFPSHPRRRVQGFDQRVTEALSLQGLKLLSRSLPAIKKDPRNLAPRLEALPGVLRVDNRLAVNP